MRTSKFVVVGVFLRNALHGLQPGMCPDCKRFSLNDGICDICGWPYTKK